MIIPVNTSTGTYDIFIGQGLLGKAGKCLNLDRKVLVVTDSGVPKEYAETILSQCKAGEIFTLPAGETNKNMDTLLTITSKLLELRFNRSDCVVAVGGGVIGDMAGFAAACYMRGIDFYNVPTTLLSQVDSSIGGKVAVDFEGVKNILGAFYPPKGVLIDPDVLKTLPPRQIANGMAEAIKMAVTFDADLFKLIEESDANENLETIIKGSLLIKKMVVEQDERESGLRRVLNFGHTIGHAIESAEALSGIYHGECVALGMIPMCAPEVQQALVPVLKKYNIPTEFTGDVNAVCDAVLYDKKATSTHINVVYCNKIGTFDQAKVSQTEFVDFVKEVYAR